MSFQTIWVGPFVGDAILDGAADPSRHMGELLAANRILWEGQKAQVYKLATGFKNPVDSEVIDNHIYVLCIGGEYSVWEITLPLASAVELSAPSWTRAGFGLVLNAGGSGIYSLQTSSNLLDWTTLWELSIPSGASFFLDGSATLAPGSRFYRTSKP